MNDSTLATPDFIWDLPTLWSLLDHPTKRVQEWAAAHVLELYPEAAEQALTLLPQAPEVVARYLLTSLEGLPLTETGVKPLRQLMLGGASLIQKAIAARLLLRIGRIPSEDELAELPVENVLRNLPDTESSVEFVMRELRGKGEVKESLIHAVSELCHVDDIYHELENLSRKELRKTARVFEKSWGIKLPPVHRAKTLGEAQLLLREVLEANSSVDENAISRFPILAGQLRGDRERITTLMQAVEDCERAAHSVVIPLVLTCVISLTRDYACLKGLSDASDSRELWRYLTLKPWKGSEVDSELVAILKNGKPENTLPDLRQALSSSWVYFIYAYNVLEALDIPDRHQLLQEALDEEYGEDLAEEADTIEETALKDPKALTNLLDKWRQQLPEPEQLNILTTYPTEEVVEFLLENFEHFISLSYSSFIVDAMEEVGSPRFLEPLAKEWREGELHLSRAVWFLADLHGMEQHEAIQHIPRNTTDDSLMEELLTDSDRFQEALETRRIDLPLRCTACKRTYRYQAERVYIGKGLHDVSLGQIVQCKGCESLETYEVTNETYGSLTMELMRIKMLKTVLDDDENPDTFLVNQQMSISAGGKTFDNLSDAFHHLKQKVDAEPENADLQRRMGNIMRNGLRPDLAVPYYQEAISLDSKDIESVYSMAEILVDQESFHEAVPYMETLVVLCRDPEADEDLGRDIFDAMLRLTVVIEQETGRRIELFSPPEPQLGTERGTGEPVKLEHLTLDPEDPQDFEQMYQLFRYGVLPKSLPARKRNETGSDLWLPNRGEPVHVTKTGRNEPCTCGSGKKYKRCCGR